VPVLKKPSSVITIAMNLPTDQQSGGTETSKDSVFPSSSIQDTVSQSLEACVAKGLLDKEQEWSSMRYQFVHATSFRMKPFLLLVMEIK
jgi:hypothetical protein